LHDVCLNCKGKPSLATGLGGLECVFEQNVFNFGEVWQVKIHVHGPVLGFQGSKRFLSRLINTVRASKDIVNTKIETFISFMDNIPTYHAIVGSSLVASTMEV
jgi:hypothetical protein